MTVHRILIADDDPELTLALASRCRQMGIAVDTASTARQALVQLESRPPELAILDVDMPEGSGLAVCEMVMHNPVLKHMPIIILTGSKDPITVQRCHQLRAFYVTKCADVWPRIRPLLEDLLEMRPGSPGAAAGAAAAPSLAVSALPPVESAPAVPSPVITFPSFAAPAFVMPTFAPSTGAPISATAAPQARSTSIGPPTPSLPLAQMIDAVFDALGDDESDVESEGASPEPQPPGRPWVLSIDDDESFSFALQLRLQEHGVDVLRAFGGREGYRSAFHNHAQAIILDYNLPEGNADYVLRRLKENPVTKGIPVIVLTGNRDRHVERQMYAMGAAYFMNKPYDWKVLWRELSRHLTFPEDEPARGFDASAAPLAASL